jgi:hypothetical protein
MGNGLEGLTCGALVSGLEYLAKSGCTNVVTPIAGSGPLCVLANSAIAEITLQNFRKIG